MHPKELWWILCNHVFAYICYVLHVLVRTAIYLKRTRIPLWNIMKEQKIAFLCCVMALHAKTRVHNFRNSLNGLEHTLFWLKSEFEHFKIQTRADFDEMLCRTLTWSSCVLNMVQFWWLVMKIWLKVDFHKIAPGWRHDDLELLKSVTILSYTNINHHVKFHDNGFIHSWDILRTN